MLLNTLKNKKLKKHLRPDFIGFLVGFLNANPVHNLSKLYDIIRKVGSSLLD